MHKIVCAACGTGYFHVRSDQGFNCDHCGSLIYPRDVSLDGSEVWAVDSAGTLGHVKDPAVSREEMTEALEEWLTSDDETSEKYALTTFINAAIELRDALRAGLPYPADA
ncbi:hypothetical protein [Streptomyces sp. NBC_01236]|uniref:hypothetical protein n=1 Tax=Streptomyces sp. NBC_01236 TaxID=2903789 RepID=UPI002E127D44|nr:hypothetical protein OG324_32310 [Streptomyces sp. NBC_01236]